MTGGQYSPSPPWTRRRVILKTLLEKTRDINKRIQKHFGSPVIFEEMCQVLRNTIVSNVYILNQNGRVLGCAYLDNYHCPIMDDIVNVDKQLPLDYNDELLNTIEARANIQRDGFCALRSDRVCHLDNKYTTFVPIYGGGERLGTLMLSKPGEFDNSDLILAEYGATVVGTEILRGQLEKIEDIARKKAAVSIALETLSYSELEAVGHIFKELGDKPGIIVGRKIAEKMCVSCSVIVNALRKMESSGVLEVHSGGMKGTHIRIMNDYLLTQLEIIQVSQGQN